MGLIHKTKFVPFIDVDGTWKQIKKSTTFSMAFNPQTKTFDFISSPNPEEEIDSYQPALSQSLTMFDDEPDFKAIFDMVFNLPTGGDAHKDVLLVFYASKDTTTTSGTTYYKAWKVDSVVKLGTLDSVNQSIDFDLALNNHDTGAVTISASGAPTWTAGTWDGDEFTPAA